MNTDSKQDVFVSLVRCTQQLKILRKARRVNREDNKVRREATKFKNTKIL